MTVRHLLRDIDKIYLNDIMVVRMLLESVYSADSTNALRRRKKSC